MSEYRAPVKDMRFIMDEIVGLAEIAQLPGYEEATPDMADAILEEAAKFTGGVLAPLNRSGDQQGCKLGPDGVTTPDGWKEAYKAFCESGWNGLAHAGRFRRPGAARDDRDRRQGNERLGQHGLLAVPDADRRRHPGHADLRQRRTEGGLTWKR